MIAQISFNTSKERAAELLISRGFRAGPAGEKVVSSRATSASSDRAAGQL